MKKYVNPDIQINVMSSDRVMAEWNVIYASSEQGGVDYGNNVGISTIDFGQLK